jgi:hypothetical protein
LSFLALRRWCSSLTLSSPQNFPSPHALWAFAAALGVLLLLAASVQGPLATFKQLFDFVGHASLVRRAARRVWITNRLVSIAIAFTVLSWTAGQALVFMQESRKADLILLTKSRGLGELAMDQGMFAALTPLRDVAGLADNLPLLLIATILVFRATFAVPRWDVPLPEQFDQASDEPGTGWHTIVWGSGALYVLYRVVSRLAGSTDLPLGNCLVAETVAIPVLMLVSDGFLLAWIVTSLRDAGLDDFSEDRVETRQALALMPAAVLACALALPARYLATFVWLASGYLPTSASATSIGNYVRWQLGWGLTDLQAASLVTIALAGAIAWSRGSIRGGVAAYLRMLTAEGGHLVAAVAIAGVASCLAAAAAYAIVLLLPAQTWILGAADSYAHFATLPIGLWTLAAFIELGERSLPTAGLVPPASRTTPSLTAVEGAYL